MSEMRLFDITDNRNPALKNNPQVAHMIDILIRRERHHIWINGSQSEKINLAVSEAILSNIQNIFPCEKLIYIDIEKIILTNNFDSIETELIKFRKNKNVIVVMNNDFLLLEHTETNLGKLVSSLLLDNSFRFIIFSNQQNIKHYQSFFTIVKLKKLSEIESLAILRKFSDELETHYQVTISNEIITSALSMATHYLPNTNYLETTAELLDSSAARASSIVTSNFLIESVSARTQISISHLSTNRFQASQIASALQQKIHGQEIAINLIGSVLQHACIKLQKNEPLCSFLFVGPEAVGKAETGYALADHLFGHADALLHIKNNPSVKYSINIILENISLRPYTVVLIENIDRAEIEIQNFINNIIFQGYYIDEDNNYYDFQNSIIIMTTTISSEKISSIMQPPQKQEMSSATELMQLVLNKNIDEPIAELQSHFSAEELIEAVTADLRNYFSSDILQQIDIIPFGTLDYSALDRIIQSKITDLVKHLSNSFGIELDCTPDITRFILQEALQQKANLKTINKLIEHHLHTYIAHEVLTGNKKRLQIKSLTYVMADTTSLSFS